ncbi:MAG: helix-turn-helix domain-containing protein, partial [Dehalococcoidia bacterium]|nr:helix-turn-helix domain-containing protein [Dehalococcoidia bacterium]
EYTHEEIGDTIGALRQTVTETLSSMRDQGLVQVERKQIRVIDRAKLAQIACWESGFPPGEGTPPGIGEVSS